MGGGTGSCSHDPTCYVALGVLCLTSEICLPHSPNGEHSTYLPEGMRLRAGNPGGLGGKKNAPEGSHTAEGGYLTLFSKWSHWSPTKLLLQPHWRVFLGRKHRSGHRGQASQSASSSATHAMQRGTSPCSCPQASTPVRLQGLQCQKCQASVQLHVQNPCS